MPNIYCRIEYNLQYLHEFKALKATRSDDCEAVGAGSHTDVKTNKEFSR